AARSVAAPPTTHSNGNALPSPPLSKEDLRDSLASTPLRFHDFADSIITRQASPDASTEHVELYERIVTLYNANAFEHELRTNNLLDRHPLLVNILRNGAPL
ncbi:hypothetical protein F5877DRAFT_2733, partial [Lentinula edodes]